MSKKILIIEDSVSHQTAARVQIPDAIVVNYNEAFDLLRKSTVLEEYSVVLTDLLFLVEEDKLISPAPFSYPINRAMIGTEQPLGMFFALRGKELGLPTAVVTDGDHHSNLFVGLLDMFGQFRKKNRYEEAHYNLGRKGLPGGIDVPVPDPRLSILYESQYLTADDMYWDETTSRLVVGSLQVLMSEQECANEALPKNERYCVPKYHGWKAVKDWRQALNVILRN